MVKGIFCLYLVAKRSSLIGESTDVIDVFIIFISSCQGGYELKSCTIITKKSVGIYSGKFQFKSIPLYAVLKKSRKDRALHISSFQWLIDGHRHNYHSH
jgi:hypothetical protein